jgi:replicative DNA helicase
MTRRADLSPLTQIMQRVDAVSDGAPSPDTVSTGFPSLDRLLGGGVRHGDLIVLGGDVGSGKSALTLAMALRAAQDDRAAAVLSGEMSIDRVMERALAIEGRARVDDIRRGSLDETTRASVGGVAVRLRDAAPAIGVIPPEGLEGMGDELRRMLDAQLIVVDPLEALVSGARPRDEELASAVRFLKMMAVELHVAIVVTAQLPGMTRERRDLRPTLDDFGALGAVKQLADVVLGLYREEMYTTGAGHGVEGATELLALKNRNGATGYVDLYFYKQWMRFEDMLDPDR